MPNKMNNLGAARYFLTDGGPWLVYLTLGNQGYNYSKLAGGVADKNSLAGGAALGFMQATANRMGKPLNETKIDSILYEMCRGYLDALTGQLVKGGWIARDINHEEAWLFHNSVFRNAGLSEDAWTLNSVFKVIENRADREAYWQQALAAAGDTSAELLLSARTYALMRKAYHSGSAEQQRYAQGWLERIESIDTANEVVRVGSQMINNSVEELFRGMSIRLSGVQTPVAAPTPTPTPAIAITPAPAPPLPPAPARPTPPVRRRGSKHRWRPSSTTRLGHPGDGFDGAVNTSYSGGDRLSLSRD